MKLEYDELLSIFTFEFNLRRYTLEYKNGGSGTNGRKFDLGQGLTLVLIFAQPEPFLSLKPAKHPTKWDRKC